jgi:hypothetical protein
MRTPIARIAEPSRGIKKQVAGRKILKASLRFLARKPHKRWILSIF